MASTIRAFVTVVLTQMSRDRTSLFFMVVLPIAIIVIIGTTFGNAAEIEVGVVGEGPQAEAALAALDDLDGVRAEPVGDVDEARRQLRRFDIEIAVVVRGDMAAEGADVLVNEANDGAFAARAIVARVLDQVAFDLADPPTPVAVEVVGEPDEGFATGGPFALTAAQNLVLFTFINALTAGAILVRARRQGVLRRALATPAGATAITLGLGAGWFVLAMAQSAIILAVGAFAFGVDWGDPVAALALLVLFALVGTGAGLLVGSVMRSEEQTSSVTPPLALVLAALGGCMVPVEVFSRSMLTVARLTPHYWALEGWKELIFRDGGLGDVATELGVLATIAVGLLGLSSILLRRTLSG